MRATFELIEGCCEPAQAENLRRPRASSTAGIVDPLIGSTNRAMNIAPFRGANLPVFA